MALCLTDCIVRNIGRVHIVQYHNERRKLQMELLELILNDNNLTDAIGRVVRNNGSGGIDKMDVVEGR